MAYVFTQIFSPKHKWIELKKNIKEQILQRMIVNLSSLAGEYKVQIIAFGQIDGEIPYAVDADFYLIWSVPFDKVTDSISQHLYKNEWNDFFEVVNIGGKALSVSAFSDIIMRDLNSK